MYRAMCVLTFSFMSASVAHMCLEQQAMHHAMCAHLLFHVSNHGNASCALKCTPELLLVPCKELLPRLLLAVHLLQAQQTPRL